jgi:hypothetical protein
MTVSGNGNETTPSTVVDRLVGVVPEKYRQEMVRFGQRIRDRLPPVMIEHRIDALERHVDGRLREIEEKIGEVLRRLEKR